MTEGQMRYQNVMENIRHNREVEAYNRQMAEASSLQAEVAQQRANTAEWELAFEMYKFPKEYELQREQVRSQTVKNAADTVKAGISAWGGYLSIIGSLFA